MVVRVLRLAFLSIIQGMRLVLFVLFFCFSVFLFNANVSSAAGLQVILTWEAQNYTPSDFAGKAPATLSSTVRVAAQGVRNGKLADLSGEDFQWFLDEDLMSEGSGLREFSFKAKKSPPGEYRVRVLVNDGAEAIQITIKIPVQKPRVTIIPSFSGKNVPGGELKFEAAPYFFNVESPEGLSFFWNMNNIIKKSTVGRFFTFNSEGDKGDVTLQISAQNPKNLLEVGKETLFFRVY